jgi:DNA recombination protein RmuC
MNPTLLLLVILVVALLAVVIIVLLRLSSVSRVMMELKDNKGNDQAAILLNQNLQGLQQRLDQQSHNLQTTLQKQFGDSTKIIQDVTERLTKLDETNKQVVNFADQLQKLQDTLKNPKQRGVLGEYYLESVLKNVLPPKHYKLQYKFKDGEIQSLTAISFQALRSL